MNLAPIVDLAPFHPQRAEQIVCAIRAGHLHRSAAQSGGVPYTTLEIWIERGRGGTSPYAEFLANLEQAWTECTNRLRDLASANPAGLAWVRTLDAHHTKNKSSVLSGFSQQKENK